MRNEPAPRLSSVVPGVPDALDLLLARCLAKDREERPASVDEVLEAFQALARQHPWSEADAREWWARHGAGLG